jgi:hypothetical protein
MIVKNTNSGWKIITQTGHAFLATQIANQLSNRFKSEFFMETLLAVYNHETLETDFNDGAILNDKGMPLDFRESETSKQSVRNKVETMVKKISNRSSIVNALICRHLQFLHEPELTKAINSDLEKIIKKTCELHKIKKKVFSEMYDILRFSDRLSLMICCDELPAIDREIEINDALDNKSTFVTNMGDDKLTIQPWIFQNDKTEIYLEYKLMNSAKFDSEQNFIDEFNSNLVEKEFIVFSNK